MKILGKAEGGWIVEISEDELANLTGYYSHYTNVHHRHFEQSIVDISCKNHAEFIGYNTKEAN